MLEKAILIATKAHQGQIDKAGQPYILHPLRVMMNCETDVEKICAVLHDVVEDTTITLDNLKEDGFSEDILEVVDLLTRRSDESYDEFIERIYGNETACKVKLADLRDNMDLCRIENPTDADYSRIDKYVIAVEKINNVLFPNANEQLDVYEIEINGCVTLPKSESEDDFYDKFIGFIEDNHWYFGGGIKVYEYEE